MKHEESNLQIQIIDWSKLCKHKEELAFLHHSPNGGSRNAREGARLKREGVKAGFPDLFLPIPRKEYHGLFIELKSKKGRTSQSQKMWLELLKYQGYCAKVCNDFDDVTKLINWYLG